MTGSQIEEFILHMRQELFALHMRLELVAGRMEACIRMLESLQGEIRSASPANLQKSLF